MSFNADPVNWNPAIAEHLDRLRAGRLHDPRLILGLGQHDETQDRFRVNLPHAQAASLPDLGATLSRIPGTSVFEWIGPRFEVNAPVRVAWTDDHGSEFRIIDPYSFPSQVHELDLGRFGSGHHYRTHDLLGARPLCIEGIDGFLFTAWAPNAERVSVIGNFNRWDGRCHPMTVHGGSGVWEIFIPELPSGELYKFEIRNRETGKIHIKSDPYGRAYEHRPANASVTSAHSTFEWSDHHWLESRRHKNWHSEPMSIYELHLGSWRRGPHGEFLNYRDIADRVGAYAKDLGFTHVEILPVTEHPFDDSWGYQSTGFFSPTSRFGSPDDFRGFVNRLHELGLGVILDWVPGHFPKDDFALARFDGTNLYEYGDPQKGEHPDWQTLVFDYTRNEVRSFLLSSAICWLQDFHIDALRVDAVASMLYLDYSREHGQWTPNMFGGNENLEAIDFLKRLNEITHGECPGTITIAEESTAWPKVSRPTYDGGLGFTFKWNMGWMHDTLSYMRKDPVHRRFHHNLLTFGPIYAFTENFILPLSHDEVVHGKGSLLGRMRGDDWQQFANLRLMYTFQWTYPGKKLLFMGGEIAQREEWNHHGELPWHLLRYPSHASIGTLVKDLNAMYTSLPALHRDCDSDGFYWLSWEDSDNSVLSYVRRNGNEHLIIVLNFTPVPRKNYRIGVPFPGKYKEIFNSDSRFYGGTDIGNPAPLNAVHIGHMGQSQSIELTLPPLAGVVLQHAGQ